jgi:hypothetical protein
MGPASLVVPGNQSMTEVPMVRTMRFLLAALLIPTLAHAEDKPVVEIGTNFGMTVLTGDRSTTTRIGIPGQGMLGVPAIYATFFTGKGVILEPQAALNYRDYESGRSITTFGLGAQAGYLFNGSEVNSGFVAVNIGFQYEKDNGSIEHDVETDFGIGGNIGYRFLAGKGLGMRVEAGYPYWIDTELNEVTFGMGIGGIAHHAQ